MLEEVKSREKLLTFDPITEPLQKLEEIKKLRQVHLVQLADSEQ